MTEERKRLDAANGGGIPWKRWGPYLAERQWGTVREDYGADGNSWDYFPHDQARSRAYRWGEDGILGVSDDEQQLCFALAMWNGADPILKERLFGLTNGEGSHGEDVKEYYYYLDSTPTHSYMRGLYKYPQRAFPYVDLVETNRARTRSEREYELIDTGIFEEDRYFDVFVEYAKATPEDLSIRIEVVNRGPEPARIRLLPTLWFRNTWSWDEKAKKPLLEAVSDTGATSSLIRATHPTLGELHLHCENPASLLFTENDTNRERLRGEPNEHPFVKDGIGAHVVDGRPGATNEARVGTKAAADYNLMIAPGESRTVRLRLVHGAALDNPFGAEFDRTFNTRRAECDAFYRGLLPDTATEDDRRVMQQSLSGMLWTKQFYRFDVDSWLDGRPDTNRRNEGWSNLHAHDILSMPDKWEYPWFAVWDSAFHTQALMLVDVEFAKGQLSVFVEDRYQREDGAIPAYEWAFSDVNPPVHAFATLRVFQFDRAKRGDQGDLAFLEWMYERLCRNFEWWIERMSSDDRDLFQGGFLGLDNIGVFDRSSELPTGGHLEQSDGTAWMVFYAQVMLRMSLVLCRNDPRYEERALYFLERVLSIAAALDRIGELDDDLWDDEDGFFYDVLHFPDGHATRLKIRSFVGLLPLAASSVFEEETLEALPRLRQKLDEVTSRPDLHNMHCPSERGFAGRRLLSVLDEKNLRRVLSRMLDEAEFLSPYGLRSLSKHHLDHPYVFQWEGQEHVVRYLPGESDSGMFGGNSNWRGPVWIPTNYVLIRALFQLYSYYGDAFRVEYPTGSGRELTLFEVARELGERLLGIFLRDSEGRRAVFGGAERFQTDPQWRDHILFYEYFNGDDGAGIGASHQTGWTGCVATIMSVLRHVSAADLKEDDLRSVIEILADSYED